MNETMTATEALLASAALDDTGFAVLVTGGNAEVAATAVEVLSGTKPTKALPAATAAAVVTRVAAGDLAAAQRVSEGDRRISVTARRAQAERRARFAAPVSTVDEGRALVAAWVGHAPAHEMPRSTNGALSLAAGCVSRMNASDEMRAAVVASIAVDGLGDLLHVEDTETPDDQLIRLADYLSVLVANDAGLFAALLDHFDAVCADHGTGTAAAEATAATARVALASAALHAAAQPRIPANDLVSALPADLLGEVFDRFRALGHRALRINAMATTPRPMMEFAAKQMFHCGVAVFGPGSVAERCGWGVGSTAPEGPGSVAPTSVGMRDLVNYVWSSAAPAAILELLEVTTCGGTVAAPASAARPAQAPPETPLSWLVAATAVPAAGLPPGTAAAYLDAFCGEHGHRWPDDELTATLDRFCEFDAAFAAALPERLGMLAGDLLEERLDVLPEVLVERSMRHVGLDVWVPLAPRYADRLAAAASGMGASRWRVLLSLLQGFRGTPEELVELTAELADAA